MTKPAILALADGSIFRGEAIGADGQTVGEVVFNTAMTGYQEILTDPSYAQQIVTLTYPHIGNTGWNDEDDESARIWVAGYVVRDLSRVRSNWRSNRSLDDELRAQGVQLRTHSDTEVILRLYEREGIGCLRRLNGMFAIAIDDAREDALYLARDRIGVKPLFVQDDGQRMLFGSEPKALWPALGGRKPGMCLEAIHHYLTFNYIPAPWTAYESVRHVMPGTWQRYTRRGGLDINPLRTSHPGALPANVRTARQ